MQPQNIDATLKKMGLVLEKMVQKINELDARVAKLEQKALPEAKPQSLQKIETKPSATPQMNPQSGSGFGHSFLGSLAGAMAGMGLYNLLFDKDVSPSQFGRDLGVDANNEELLEQIDEKLDTLDEKIDALDDKLDSIEEENMQDIDSLDDLNSFTDDTSASDFDFDDFGGGFDDV